MRNIHFAAAAAITAPAVAHTSHVEQEQAPVLRTRTITRSPAEEYAARPGQVSPIGDALASCILSFTGRAEITAKGIIIDRKELGGRRTYHSESSVICNDLSCRERKWHYVLNRQQPDRVHILNDQGEYVETLPLIFMPHVLNTAEQAAVAAAHKRQIRRVATHLQSRQGEATEQAIEQLRHTAESLTRYTQTFDALPAADRHSAPEPAPESPLGRIAAYDRAAKQASARRASAVDLGRAISTSRPVPAPAAEVPSEDWSDHPRNLTPATPTAPARQTIVEEVW